MAERVYRDPLHGSISFDRKTEEFVIELIDTREFQRLRRIRQLGAASLVFHGAEHSRFAHSIGVAFLAKKIFDRVKTDPYFPADSDADHWRRAVLAGALLHDVGHGPFSHLFERVFQIRDHEEWGLEIARDAETDVGQVLRRHGLADSVQRIFTKDFTPRFARDIISSQLDADRLDYLLRDSYMTGVEYGRYDLAWLLEVMELGRLPNNGKELTLSINRRKFHAAEQFVIGRHLMYQQVYFHKTIRSAERMIKLIFERLTELAKAGTLPHFYPEPLPLLTSQGGSRMSVKAYLELDDQFMITCFHKWSTEEGCDTILSDLCLRLANRNLFKTAIIDPVKIKDGLKYAQDVSALSDAMTVEGFDPRYYLAADTAEDFPYKDIMWFLSKERKPEDIWLAEQGSVVAGLSDPNVSPLIDSIRNTRIAVQRVCFPAEVRALVSKHLHPYLSDRIDGGGYRRVHQSVLEFQT